MIEELKKIREDSTRFVDELKDKVHEQYEEIERLNKENKELQGRFNSLMEAHKICDEENNRLNSVINEFNSSYSKIIKECEEMINERYYMSENAIKYYANRIRDIAKYYIEEPKWQELKGSDKE